MKAKSSYFIFALLLFGQLLFAQRPTLPEGQQATTEAQVFAPPDTFQIRMSGDSLDQPVEYFARDSMIYDIAHKRILLYGAAGVNYSTIRLTADYIAFDWDSGIVEAGGMPDSLGQLAGFPDFSEGDQNFTAKRMRYNFKSRKGIVYDVTSTQNDVYVRGSRSQFTSGDPADTTSTDLIYSEDAIFTTCQHEEPHFGIRSRKQKVIPNKLVVIGPSNLEIMGVPTPLWLPFGFFPLSSGRSTGLIFPRDYEYSRQWGFGLRDVGWFFPLGEHFNLAVTSNIYIKGTWGVNVRSQYRKRYGYNGNFAFGFDSRRNEGSDGTVNFDKSYSLRWTHTQDQSAHPTANFGGSINIQTNNFQSRVFNDAVNVLQNQLSSNLSFRKNWRDKPFNMSASFNHSQNSATRAVTVDFPNVNFLTQTLYPFRKKERVGPRKWYEDVTMRYTADMRNRLTATDTTLFDAQTFEDARFGVKHTVSSGTSFKVLRYFNLNPGVNYQEVWYLNRIEKEFLQDITQDTVITTSSDGTRSDTTFVTRSSNQVATNRINGFNSFRQVNASLSLNTQIFGTLQFKKGWLRGVRHVIKPSIAMNFAPDYLNSDLGYFDFVQNASDPNRLDRYSVYEGGVFGAPPASGQQMALSYSLNNILEAKFFSQRDSTVKKVSLFNNLNISGNYNFAADSLKWSQVSAGGTARFFKGATTMTLRAVFDPYQSNELGQRINTTLWEDSRKLLRFVNAGINFNSNLNVSKLRAIFQGKEEEYVDDVRNRSDSRIEPAGDDFLSLFENFGISHNLSLRWDNTRPGQSSFAVATHAINVQGNVQLTGNWSVNVGNFGYDFVRKGLSYPSIGFQRDLHCWEMGLNWQPTRGTYSFYIQVKPGTLDFLKIPYQQNNADGGRRF